MRGVSYEGPIGDTPDVPIGCSMGGWGVPWGSKGVTQNRGCFWGGGFGPHLSQHPLYALSGCIGGPIRGPIGGSQRGVPKGTLLVLL